MGDYRRSYNGHYLGYYWDTDGLWKCNVCEYGALAIVIYKGKGETLEDAISDARAWIDNKTY